MAICKTCRTPIERDSMTVPGIMYGMVTGDDRAVAPWVTTQPSVVETARHSHYPVVNVSVEPYTSGRPCDRCKVTPGEYRVGGDMADACGPCLPALVIEACATIGARDERVISL